MTYFIVELIEKDAKTGTQTVIGKYAVVAQDPSGTDSGFSVQKTGTTLTDLQAILTPDEYNALTTNGATVISRSA